MFKLVVKKEFSSAHILHGHPGVASGCMAITGQWKQKLKEIISIILVW